MINGDVLPVSWVEQLCFQSAKHKKWRQVLQRNIKPSNIPAAYAPVQGGQASAIASGFLASWDAM